MLGLNSLALHYEFYCFYFSRGRRVGVRCVCVRERKRERAEWREAQRDPSLSSCAAAIRKDGSDDGQLPNMLHSTQRQERCDQSEASFIHTFFYTLLQHCSLAHTHRQTDRQTDTHTFARSSPLSLSHTHTHTHTS